MSDIDHSHNIIEINQVSFSYDHDLTLDDITFNIHQGDYLGIIGPNGGGKTTLLKIMIGLLSPLKGSVKLFGQDIKHFKEWNRIGYVPQKLVSMDAQFPATVEEVVSMGLFGKKGLFHFLTADDNNFVNESLRHVDMEQYKTRRIGDLSSGQQQRVFIARALVAKPDVLFLDEPTTGVDIKAQEQFYLLLKKLNRDLNITLVLVSHEIDIVAQETTEVACINRSLIYHGSPKEFINSNMLASVYGKNVKIVAHHH